MNGESVDVAGLRVGYGRTGDDDLEADWLTGDPPWLDLFTRWLADGVSAAIPEPNAMVVATVDADGMPSTRTVLCKGVDERGIVFYTGYGSDKGTHLAARPVASATFPWIAVERQVHFRGPVVRISREETAAYWATRPRGSQLGAHASDQSRPIASRAELLAQAQRVAQRFGGEDGTDPVEVPETWGGFRIEPTVVEFWQGRANRLHNRIRATRNDRGWDIGRFQP
ncbi:pyridoxamine 5'-phosphate oxidase [Williamsia sp. CHRR-6]|uniref:pyridoxamine 5'-phosphate oxidase n=1 Tax=Williamsia sp. CHRR-6 TaxID=2835871 RepID=UPI001BDADFC6|nr:pyridoxamine 5'-phosphate oxidase [Williamsia sp. CHRR-6]MBT0566429.1 pyridoxamine 5'-phosphate oxidase [Williamsia sp. CHRR-6]